MLSVLLSELSSAHGTDSMLESDSSHEKHTATEIIS